MACLSLMWAPWVGSRYLRLGAATTKLIDMVMRVYHTLTWLWEVLHKSSVALCSQLTVSDNGPPSLSLPLLQRAQVTVGYVYVNM